MAQSLFSKETVAEVRKRFEKGIESIETNYLFVRIVHYFSHRLNTLSAIGKNIAIGVWVIFVILIIDLILK